MDQNKFAFLIKRSGAYGDVLCTEPIISFLIKCGYEVFLDSKCREVLLYVPLLIHVNDLNYKSFGNNIIDLNDAYEKNPEVHIIEAYCKEAFNSTGVRVNKRPPKYFFSRDQGHNDLIINRLLEKKSFGVITFGIEGSWVNRTWPKERFKVIAEDLKKHGYTIIELGRNKSNYMGVGINFLGSTNIDLAARLIKESVLFIGCDSLLFHLSQAVGIRSVVIFGCVDPKTRVHDYSLCSPVWLSDLECAGCHHKNIPQNPSIPRYFTKCYRDKIHCLDGITTEMATKIVDKNIGLIGA